MAVVPETPVVLYTAPLYGYELHNLSSAPSSLAHHLILSAYLPTGTMFVSQSPVYPSFPFPLPLNQTMTFIANP
jgi:hypothetical protein